MSEVNDHQLMRRPMWRNAVAVDDLRRDLPVNAPLIARKALDSDDDRSPLVRWVRAAARCVRGTDSRTPGEEQEELVHSVAHFLRACFGHCEHEGQADMPRSPETIRGVTRMETALRA